MIGASGLLSGDVWSGMLEGIDRPSNALQGLFVDGTEGLKRGWNQEENYDFEQLWNEDLAKQGYYERDSQQPLQLKYPSIDRLSYIGSAGLNTLADPFNVTGLGLFSKGAKGLNTSRQLLSRLKDKKAQLDAGVISKAEYELAAKDIEFLRKHPQLLKENGTWYHGTSTPIEELGYAPSMFNFYGSGLYSTKAKGMSRKYTKKGGGDKPTIYKVIEKNPKSLNLNIETTPAIFGKDVLSEIFTDDQLINMSLREAIDRFRSQSKDFGYPAHEVTELINSIFDKAYRQGYKSITHYGGRHSGGKKHMVKIFTHPPEDIKKLKKVNKYF